MERTTWERRASFLITLCLGGALVYLAVQHALPILLPFLVAWLLSAAVRPLSARISSRTGLPQRGVSVLLLLLLLGGVFFLFYVSVRRLLGELQRLPEWLLSEVGGFFDSNDGSGGDPFDVLLSKIPFFAQAETSESLSSLRAALQALAERVTGELVTALSAWVPDLLGRMASALPTLLLAALITVIAGFYFCVDGEGILTRLSACLPTSVRIRLPEWRQRIRRLSWCYLRACLLLLLLTFSELFLGFCILGIDYALLLAALTALVDLLPVLGVGSVLLPWSVVSFLRGQMGRGLGLLILYLIIGVVRQILEPRLIGKSLGLHPLAALLATYAGWRLLGVSGIFLGPLLALVVKSLLIRARE